MRRLARSSGVFSLIAAAIVLVAPFAIEPIEAHDRNALALSVEGCVISKRTFGIAFPCLEVDLAKGYAVLRPPRATSEVLVVPTVPISGIESPALQAAGAPHYFAAAWDARRFVASALPSDPGWSGIGMAVNSRPSRSQDLLHIHVDCLEPAVAAALARDGRRIGRKWVRFPDRLAGGRYFARFVSAAAFDTMNPFAELREGLPIARRAMADMTLAVAGAVRPDGSRGFYLLAANTRTANVFGEDLLDHACRAARGHR